MSLMNIVMERIDNFAVFILNFALCGASLIKTPSNKAVIAGQRMEMECQTDSGSVFRKWDFLQVGSKSPRAVAINGNAKIEILKSIPGYGVDAEYEGSVTLYSNLTKTKNAGVYICQGESISGSTEFKYSAQLIVFESEPICEINIIENTNVSDGDYILMQCRVNFSGNWAPSMEWKQHQVNKVIDEGRLVPNATVAVVIQNSSITSTIVILIDLTIYDSYYSCRTYFTWQRLKTNAANVPDFNHTWISTSIMNLINRKSTSNVTDSTRQDITAKTAIENADIPTILLITGVCLFLCTLIVAIVGVAFCISLSRKSANAKEGQKSAEVLASEYDLIPYSITDSYDTIEDVDERNDILVTNYPPRREFLPSPGYSGLRPGESKPPGVYSRMDYREKLFEDETNDANEMKLQSDVHKSNPDHLSLTDVKETTRNTKMRVNSYLDLTTDLAQDIAAENEEMPSAYLKITDDSVQLNAEGNALETP